ncbi:hypothetical protein MYCTH_2300262 [Thermothelomyces thermophilus ATCC 42464]|uniref:Uncharacterized protein n=1 Tax=Thermothelomyces thermophilus (strain ATCC 42464 / BCRC 31852 / DSM 1799) TaxID=573729 RepID=G2QAT5_THET4|nr:uncharacterized protein MYCTH_2300262 [Thermothelomyces thermophilus ATCC 42464]AEO55927.1 hypothetical protein MYCTH_2300262 [Thermothelomyces thermophilus ATCC 42464]
MVSPGAAALAALFTTVCSVLLPATASGQLVLLLAPKHSDLFVGFPGHGLLWKALQAALGTSILVLLFLWSLRATGGTFEPSCCTGSEKVSLYPCRTTHSRLLPKQHSFSYSYLLVGIPVSFEGNAGGMVSVRAKARPGLLSWFPIGFFGGWFTVDAGDYLERGKSELSLREKLDRYLLNQGVCPKTYPYAYLITAARFLGYHFNPVSFWYLYDARKHLAAMILEVNNTFDERRMYFLTEESFSESQSDGFSTCSCGGQQSKRPSQRVSCERTFRQAWPKDFHVSPFNSRKGSYTLTASDPLASVGVQGMAAPISITITLLSSKGDPKMVATLSSAGDPLEPSTMTSRQKACFLASWWHVGFLTYPRILKQAAALFFRHRLRVWFRPEPLKGTLSRRATATERQLEAVFRRYLQHLVEQAQVALEVKYIAAAGILLDKDVRVFTSPAAREKRAEKRGTGSIAVTEELELAVLTPAFYTRFVRYQRNGLNSFLRELNEARTIWLSRPELLRGLFASQKKESKPCSTNTAPSCSAGLLPPGFWELVCFRVIPYLRSGNVLGLSELDEYVMQHDSERERERYGRCVLQVMLADRITLRSVAGLKVLEFVVLVYLTWWLLGFVLGWCVKVSLD